MVTVPELSMNRVAKYVYYCFTNVLASIYCGIAKENILSQTRSWYLVVLCMQTKSMKYKTYGDK
jgi:hypothetical protein